MRLLAATGALFGIPAGFVMAVPGTFSLIDPPAGTGNSTVIQDVTAEGSEIFGSVRNIAAGFSRAARFRNGTWETIDLLLSGFDNSLGYAISDDGSVTVAQAQYAPGRGFPIRYSDTGTAVLLGDIPIGTGNSVPAYTNADGSVIVGVGETSAGQTAWRWTDSVGYQLLGHLSGGADVTTAAATNAAGDLIVGSSSMNQGIEAYRWTQSTGLEPLGELSGGDFGSRAFDVSDDGRIIVGSSEGTFGVEAVRWVDGGAIEPLGDLPGGDYRSSADVVSGNGRVIGGFASDAEGTTAAIWIDGQIFAVDDLLRDRFGIDVGDTELARVRAISADGTTIIGDTTGLQSWVAVIPAPTSAVVLGLGAVPAMGRRR